MNVTSAKSNFAQCTQQTLSFSVSDLKKRMSKVSHLFQPYIWSKFRILIFWGTFSFLLQLRSEVQETLTNATGGKVTVSKTEFRVDNPEAAESELAAYIS